LESRSPALTVEGILPTEVADPGGFLHRRARKTRIELYKPLAGSSSMLFEMGIPIVETGDQWSYNVLQKVPLGFSRDNVAPSYLSRLRALALEAASTQLTTEEAGSEWVRNALEKRAADLSDRTVRQVAELKFGSKRVAYDPSDLEANHLAVSQGYTVVHGGALSKVEWDAVRRSKAILPAGQVTPSPKPFSPDGKPLRFIQTHDWSDQVRETIAYVREISARLLGTEIEVKITPERSWKFRACYGGRCLIFNIGLLGQEWFDLASNLEGINSLLIHELGHHFL
jgi:hypothetical protein